MARLPNFIFLGPDKSGSTWLHAALSEHPQVYLTPGKDLHFFDRYFDRGTDWYARQFRGAEPRHVIVGEIGTRYLYEPRAAARMHRTVPDAKLMTCVRDPVKRAFSSYLYLRRQGKRLGSFAEALDSTPAIVRRCRYATHLNRYLERYGEDHIYVGVFDDLQQDPQGYLDGLMSWLGLDPMTIPAYLLEPRLPASKARSRRLGAVASRTARRGHERGLAHLVVRAKNSTVLQRLLYRPVGDDDPKPTEQDVDRIRELLDDDIGQLEDMFGLELRKRWGWT